MTEQLTDERAEPSEAAPEAAPDAPGEQPPGEQPVAAQPVAAPPAAEPLPAGPSRRRRVLWAVARWTAAVVVLGGVGAGTALGITSLDRDEVPGLATESDGRWDYPALSLPALPVDRPRPFTGSNDAEIHYADIRRLLLPEPAGATPDARLTGGFVTTEAYLGLYGEEFRGELRSALADSALRHIAARGWTMPDGTRSTVHVLRFASVAYAQQFEDEAVRGGYSSHGVKALPTGVELALPETFAEDIEVPDVRISAYREQQPYGPEHTRVAYIQAGDSLAVVTHTRKGEAAEVPFRQTVTLQAQLLG
ncbi:hypothetical protein [Streptomyces sp. NPDC058955]|uniref:hypothetical protein n=1 Tax=unclassified Streptomyces TaxID=2593676 RepID=UPI00365889DF